MPNEKREVLRYKDKRLRCNDIGYVLEQLKINKKDGNEAWETISHPFSFCHALDIIYGFQHNECSNRYNIASAKLGELAFEKLKKEWKSPSGPPTLVPKKLYKSMDAESKRPVYIKCGQVMVSRFNSLNFVIYKDDYSLGFRVFR